MSTDCQVRVLQQELGFARRGSLPPVPRAARGRVGPYSSRGASRVPLFGEGVRARAFRVRRRSRANAREPSYLASARPWGNARLLQVGMLRPRAPSSCDMRFSGDSPTPSARRKGSARRPTTGR
eukprot:5805272-Lingulodinium_polyedra.AAC.1